ncbi:MAG: hypothetical protein GY714_24175 [Desulfobacterales bacterium]|nr:hypothetical protein [Desulfobacterales bacterium]MCP4163914.1 hypothetical protein [Deltaproteobacteria bacterium]
MAHTITLANTKLNSDMKKMVEEFCISLLKIETIEVKSVNVYGKDDLSLLIIVKNLDIEELKAIKDIVADIRRFGVNTFFITEQNLLTSTDVFPIKFMIIKESYTHIAGDDFLKNLEISDEYLRLRCEQEIKNLILKLKHFYLANYGMRLMDIMKQTIENFIENLRILVFLKTGDKPSFDDSIEKAAALCSFDTSIITEVKNLENLNEKPKAEKREEIFGGYIDVVYQVAQFVDRM